MFYFLLSDKFKVQVLRGATGIRTDGRTKLSVEVAKASTDVKNLTYL